MSGWISVDDRFPEDEVRVLVYCAYGVMTGAVFFDRDPFSGTWTCEWYSEGEKLERAVTHWMPLPDPPSR